MIGVAQNRLVSLSLRRPITMLMVLLSMLVLGGVALMNIPLELVPSGFSPPFLRVVAPYPDATSTDVEERITRPLEQAVATTPGVDRISSTSTAGQASLTLLFKPEVDMRVAYRQVRDRIARVRNELPEEVSRVEIRKESAEGFPVAFYSVIWEPDVSDPLRIVEDHLIRKLERIDGVAVVQTFGPEEPQVQIDIDRAAAQAANVNMVQLVQTLARSNFTLASGTIEHENDTYLLRSVARWENLDDVENLIIAAPDVRLRDIATVRYDRPPRTRYDRFRGKPSMVLSVAKESQANTVDVSDRIKDAVAEAVMAPEFQSITVTDIFIQGDTIRFSLRQVVESGFQGGLLALLVLGIFLRRFRLTALVSLSIPLSMFLSLPVMDFTGQTINIVSLVGLMICIGLVVDNSVVVAENITRYRERGLRPFAASMQGASEVGLAIALATMTTIVVFLPAALLSSGPTQFFMIRMITPVCVSLLASLFVALVLIPLASATLLSVDIIPADALWLQQIDRGWKGVVRWIYQRTVEPCARLYLRLLRLALRRRADVAVISLFALGSIAIPAMHVSCASGGNLGSRMVRVRYSMPSNTTLEEADAFFKGLEVQVDAVSETYNIEGMYVGFEADHGQAQIFFYPPKPDDPPFEPTAQELLDRLPTPPGWTKTSSFGDSDGAREDTFQVIIYGDDHPLVQEAREALEEQLLAIDGVIGLREYDDTRRREELALTIDRAAAERFGVSANIVANTVGYAIRGAVLPRYQTDRDMVDVRIRYREDDRRDVEQLLGYQVPIDGIEPSVGGGTVPLRVLADQDVREGEARRTRTNKRIAATIRLDLDKETKIETIARIQSFIDQYRLPEGLSFDDEAFDRDVDSMQRDLLGALGLGAIFVFLLMGFLFESVILPLSVLPAIPLAFVGVWWFLFITGESIDELAGIGMVLLLGVVVNNAIVIIDFVNQARARGLERTEALISAGALRFRPILMTALTTIGGMLPLAFSQPTGEGIPYGPFGKVLVGGMTTSTLLTLIVVPVAYTLFDDLRNGGRAWLARVSLRR